MNREQEIALERIDRARDAARIADEYLSDAIRLALDAFDGTAPEIQEALGLTVAK